MGSQNQRLIVNCVFKASRSDDPIARSIEQYAGDALKQLAPVLASLPRDDIALGTFDMVGLAALRALLVPASDPIMRISTPGKSLDGAWAYQIFSANIAWNPQRKN